MPGWQAGRYPSAVPEIKKTTRPEGRVVVSEREAPDYFAAAAM
jgi:hypothetical protein